MGGWIEVETLVRDVVGGRGVAVIGTKKSPVRISDRASKNMAATYSPALWCSTIGHEGLNFSVRYGKR